MKLLTVDDVRAIMRRIIKESGNQRAAAARLGVSHAMFNDVYRGKDDPNPKLLRALQLERVLSYRRMPNA